MALDMWIHVAVLLPPTNQHPTNQLVQIESNRGLALVLALVESHRKYQFHNTEDIEAGRNFVNIAMLRCMSTYSSALELTIIWALCRILILRP